MSAMMEFNARMASLRAFKRAFAFATMSFLRLVLRKIRLTGLVGTATQMNIQLLQLAANHTEMLPNNVRAEISCEVFTAKDVNNDKERYAPNATYSPVHSKESVSGWHLGSIWGSFGGYLHTLGRYLGVFANAASLRFPFKARNQLMVL